MAFAEKIIEEIDKYYLNNGFIKPMLLYDKFCEILPKLEYLDEYRQLEEETREIAWSRMEDEDAPTELPPEWHEMMERSIQILKISPITGIAAGLISCNCGIWCKDNVSPRMNKVVQLYEGTDTDAHTIDAAGTVYQ